MDLQEKLMIRNSGTRKLIQTTEKSTNMPEVKVLIVSLATQKHCPLSQAYFEISIKFWIYTITEPCLEKVQCENNVTDVRPLSVFTGHPNVKVFITHGGLMGTMEAVYNGVPMVAIPLFGDQFHNVKNFEEEGIALRVDYTAIKKETVLKALREVLENPR